MNLNNKIKDNPTSIKILHTDQTVQTDISEAIISWLPRFPREYIVVCIGTDRSTGDALGPLTGTFLNELQPKHLHVYGTLHEPVHAKNLTTYLDEIADSYKQPFIIAVDACLANGQSIGCLTANIGSLKPGAAVNKQLPPVGDIHLTGIVNIGGFMSHTVLQSTRLSIVVDMAKQLSQILKIIDEQLTTISPLSRVLNFTNKKRS